MDVFGLKQFFHLLQPLIKLGIMQHIVLLFRSFVGIRHASSESTHIKNATASRKRVMRHMATSFVVFGSFDSTVINATCLCMMLDSFVVT
jgi:hypothetical protein